MLPDLTAEFVVALQKTRQEIAGFAPAGNTVLDVFDAGRVLFEAKEDQYSSLTIRYGGDLSMKRPQDLAQLISRFMPDELKTDCSEDEMINYFLLLLTKIEIILRYTSSRSFDNADYYGRVLKAVIMFEHCLLTSFLEKLFSLNQQYRTILTKNSLTRRFYELRNNLLIQRKFQKAFFTPSILNRGDLRANFTQLYQLVRIGRIVVPPNPDAQGYDFIELELGERCWPCHSKLPAHNLQYCMGSSKNDETDHANRQLWLFLQYCNPANQFFDFNLMYVALLKTIALFNVKTDLNRKTKPLICALITFYYYAKLYIEANSQQKYEYLKMIHCEPVGDNRTTDNISEKCIKHSQHELSGLRLVACEQHPEVFLMKCCAVISRGIEVANSRTWCAQCKEACVLPVRGAMVVNPAWRHTIWRDEDRQMEVTDI